MEIKKRTSFICIYNYVPFINPTTRSIHTMHEICNLICIYNLNKDDFFLEFLVLIFMSPLFKTITGL